MKSVDVLGQTYKIIRVKGLTENHSLHGLCDAESKTIHLDSKLKGKYLKRIMLHEIAHAFAFECGLCEFMDTQSSEMFAQCLSSFLDQFILVKIK